ncbi:MAG: amino acid ABC transporter substrate-binding protein [Deferribacteraceae bacterium]|jgi:polar amino acid transport system substrate-binding protein|nr:amino acid ABC transporter substrate-binding protein [Deferribacteraceae bacterium]
MKRILVLLTVAIFALTACKRVDTNATKGAAETAATPAKFILGFDDSFPPMGFKENGEYVGFDIDLAREVTKRLNMELVLQPIIWDVKEQELNTNKIDCIWNGFTMTPEREAAMAFTKPYMNNKQIVVVLKDSPVQTLADLAGKKLALQRDSSAADALDKHATLKPSLGELLEFEDNVMAMTDLDTNNCDAVLMDVVVANYNYIKKAPDKYRLLEESLADERFGIGFRKTDVALKDKVEATLMEMANDGTVANISTKWFGSDITTLK